jgi:hypothetical protein
MEGRKRHKVPFWNGNGSQGLRLFVAKRFGHPDLASLATIISNSSLIPHF